MKRWPIILAVLMLGATWGLLESLSHGEPILAKKPFNEFPTEINDRWEGRELGMEQKILDVLKLSDYMMRVYVPKPDPSLDSAALSPVWLYVGYYQSQRSGATYHSPKNCLPGAGWQFVESEPTSIAVAPATTITINRAVIQKGLDKQVILYWYQDRGRVISSEYWAKGYMMWDAMTQNRTDGSLIRISLPVVTTTDDAYRHGVSFLKDIWPLLQEYMPAGVMAA
jgi:EpsI family protein